jgi:hypothetical protein
MAFRHFLVMQIGWVVFDGIFPQPVVILAFRLARHNGYFLPFDLDDRARLCQQVIVPASILVLTPIGTNQEIETFRLKIGDRRDMLPAGLASNCMQQQDGLRTKPAADAPPADPDGEGIRSHEGLQKVFVHLIPEAFSRKTFIGSQ